MDRKNLHGLVDFGLKWDPDANDGAGGYVQIFKEEYDARNDSFLDRVANGIKDAINNLFS